MDNLYRLFTKNKEGEIINDSLDSIFDLIGHKEPDQTKALGYVLAKSNASMKSFLKILGIKIKNVSPRIVDCELTQPKGSKESDRADIVVRFPNEKQAIFVEAKSASSSIGSTGASVQVEGYLKRFTNFDGYNTKLVTLTSYSSVSQTRGVKNITWSNIIDAFLSSEEGFNAGWGGILGYYSGNQKIASVEGDPALAVWKQQCVVEDVQYIDSVYATVVKFINMQMAAK